LLYLILKWIIKNQRPEIFLCKISYITRDRNIILLRELKDDKKTTTHVPAI